MSVISAIKILERKLLILERLLHYTHFVALFTLLSLFTRDLGVCVLAAESRNYITYIYSSELVIQDDLVLLSSTSVRFFHSIEMRPLSFSLSQSEQQCHSRSGSKEGCIYECIKGGVLRGHYKTILCRPKVLLG